MTVIRKANKRQSGSESGQAMVEYALIIAILVIAIFIVVSGGFAARLFDMFQFILNQVRSVF